MSALMAVESLLHDPSTYSTYSQQWYNLLQHLSLSHTLIVLHLRNMPALAFPISAPLPFEDENGTSAPQLPFSASGASLSSINLPRSRMSSTAGSDAGSTAPTNKMPRHERLMEISMPEPLAAQPRENAASAMQHNSSRKTGRRGSINSIASAASLSFGRKRSNSTATGTEIRADMVMNVTGPAAQWAAPTMSGKAALPPVSYPNAKRYGFTRHGDPLSVSGRTRTSSESGRPGSIFSIQSSSSISPHQRLGSSFGGRLSFIVDRQAPPVPGLPVGMTSPSPIAGKHRASVSGSDAGRSTRLSEYGGSSPVPGRRGSPYQSRRDLLTLTMKVEPAFENPPPYIPGRAPILRVFVPLSERLRQWPSAEGAKLAIKELDKCGATRRLKLGDLVVIASHMLQFPELTRSDKHSHPATQDNGARPTLRPPCQAPPRTVRLYTLLDWTPPILC